MTRMWPEGEPIIVALDGQGNPIRFVWQGHIYRVSRIWQRWQTDSEWWSPQGRVWRAYVSLSTNDGLLCVLYHDRLADEWFLSKLYD